VDDRLVRAEIEIIAGEREIEIAGFGTDEMLTIPAGRAVSLTANALSESEPVIFKPGPLKGGALAVIGADGDIDPISERELSSLEAGAPIVYSIPDAGRVDLLRFRGVAAQAANHGRPLVIVAGRIEDG
jgi:hypothetical protein